MTKRRIVLIVISLLLCMMSMIQIIQLDILPIKYFILIIIGMIISLLLEIFLFRKDKKICFIIGIILFFVLVLTNVIGIYHMNNINNFFQKSFQEMKTEKIKYYVVALEKNHYKKKDISDDIGYYEESINVNNALDVLKKKYKFEELNFSDMNHLFDELDNSNLKMIIIEKNNFGIMMELNEERDEDKYSIIEEFTIEKKLKKSKNRREDAYNIYVGGTDYVGLMDFNTIISVNNKTHTILLTSIPRDYYVDVAGYDYKNKLSFITEGIDVSKESIANLFGIDIDYSVKIDSDSVVKLVDEIGGIEYCSDYSYTGAYNIYVNGSRKSVSYSIKKGCQHLNGYEAIAASRTRNAFSGRDRVRQQNMQKIMVAIMKKMVTGDNLVNYEGILNSLSDSYETDIPKNLITRSIKDIINNGNRWTIEVQSVDGEDGKDSVHRFSNITDWVMYPNEEDVRTASERIKRNLGENKE